jgi:DnaJ homolog subfamily C member 2
MSLEDKSGNVSEDDEPEDPAMLERDPKEWKVAPLEVTYNRIKTTMRFSDYQSIVTKQQTTKSRKPIAKRHLNTILIKKQAEAMKTMIPFLNVSRKVPTITYLSNVAYETLSDPVKRRQFDSVDEGAEVEAPGKKTKGNFFKLWRPFFEAEARFSNRTPVPSLGTIDTPQAETEAFYNFWLTFDSWRGFEYLDKDPPDEGDNRDNKRWQEKKNKAERAKRKRDDNTRLRKAVEEALIVDPRIQLYKDNAKKEKERKKYDKEAGARKAAEEAKIKEEEERKKKEEDAIKEKAAREDNKKNKEAAKSRIKKEKRIVKGSVKEVNYFAGGVAPSAGQIDQVLHDVELVMERLKGDKLTDIAGKLDGKKTAEEVRSVFEGILTAGDVKPAEMRFFGKQVNGV